MWQISLVCGWKTISCVFVKFGIKTFIEIETLIQSYARISVVWNALIIFGRLGYFVFKLFVSCMHTGLHFDTRNYHYSYKESTTPNNDRFAIFSQESLILDILGALVPYCSPHLHSCIKNSLLVLITKNNNCKLKFICILLIESWSMLKNVGCIKEAKSTGLHFTTTTK